MSKLLCWITILIGIVWLIMSEKPAALLPIIVGTICLYSDYKNKNN